MLTHLDPGIAFALGALAGLVLATLPLAFLPDADEDSEKVARK